VWNRNEVPFRRRASVPKGGHGGVTRSRGVLSIRHLKFQLRVRLFHRLATVVRQIPYSTTSAYVLVFTFRIVGAARGVRLWEVSLRTLPRIYRTRGSCAL